MQQLKLMYKSFSMAIKNGSGSHDDPDTQLQQVIADCLPQLQKYGQQPMNGQDGGQYSPPLRQYGTKLKKCEHRE